MISILARVWWAVALRGLALLLFGLAALFWPGATPAALILLFGAFALADGVVTLGAMLAGAGLRPWWAQLVGALLSLAAAALAFLWPGLTAPALLYLMAAWALLRGLSDIAAALQWRKEIVDEWLLALGGVISVLFAVALLLQPGAGILALLWMMAAYSLVLGVLLIALGFRLRGLRKRARVTRPLDPRTTAD